MKNVVCLRWRALADRHATPAGVASNRTDAVRTARSVRRGRRSCPLRSIAGGALWLATVLVTPGRAAPEKGALTLVEAGKPRASIVLAAGPTKAAVLAAVELRDHVRKITGAELPIVPDTEPVSGTRILVGESTATRALRLGNADFKPQEYLIRVQGSDLILMGRDADRPFGLTLWGVPNWVPGRFGQALSFDGTHDAVILEEHGFDDAQGSLEAWVEVAPEAKGGIVLRLDGDPWSYHIVSFDKGEFTYVTYDGKAGNSVKSGAVTPGWHHLLATWSAATKRIEFFVDGKSAGTAGYSPTHCAKALLGIGAMAMASGSGQGNFTGVIDEVRLSGSVRAAADLERAPAEDDAALAILHFDEGAGAPRLSRRFTSLRLARNLLPDPYDGEGTCYAVYHFLEQFCGVRWYGPTEVCTVTPASPTLTVRVTEVRRTPSMAWRCVMPSFNFGDLMPTVKGLWGDPTVDEMWVYAHRMRNGGEAFHCTHTFYGYPDRFWHKNPQNEKAWEGQHLEWFAHGYDGRPTQLCYSSQEVVAQVVTDARNFFDGNLSGGGAGRFFGIGPGDDNSFCKCPVCKERSVPAESLKGLHFTNGQNSDYIFGFCNRVAKEVRTTHPDKYLAVLTYMSWTRHPRFRLEPNIAVQLALAGNMFLDDPAGAVGRDIWRLYQEWIDKEGKRRPIYLWLYPEFPESWVWSRGYTAFPGFGARLIAKQMKRYARDGIRGLFPEGITTQLNEYMYNQLAFDAAQDADRLITEFFTLYYGAAAAPMRKLWLDIEATYTDPANWPEDLVKADKDIPITEETSWKRLGTTERMDRWSGYMAEAKACAATDTEKARVRLFEQGQWDPMVKAKRLYDSKSKYAAEVAALQTAPPPASRIPRLAVPASGDLAKVDWTQGETLRLSRDIFGYPAPERQVEATILHDGQYLYLRLQEKTDATKLQAAPDIFTGDDWELFWAAQRERPYRQIGINPRGAFQAIPYGEPKAWDHALAVASEATPDAWTTRLCLPLANVIPDGLKPGQTLYFNVVRASTAAQTPLAYSPHFILNFHVPARLAALKVE